MSARTLTVVLGDTWAEFAGYGSRELYVSLRGRPPVWNTRTRRWTAQLRTARDLVALAESRGWDIAVTAAEPEPARPSEGLW